MKCKISIFLLTAFLINLCSCDPAYNLSYIYENKTNDTIHIIYSYLNLDTATTLILPNEKKTFLTDFVIRKASSFGDCCPCKFASIKTTDTAIHIFSPDQWMLEIKNKNSNNKEGYVNCTFTK